MGKGKTGKARDSNKEVGELSIYTWKNEGKFYTCLPAHKLKMQQRPECNNWNSDISKCCRRQQNLLS